MKLRIRGIDYPLVTHQTAELLHLMELKVQSRPFSEDGKGWGMDALQAIADGSAAAAKNGEPAADAYMTYLAVITYLTRRGAGEDLKFADALRVPVSEIEPIIEPEDEAPAGEAVDPTTPGDGPATPAAEASPQELEPSAGPSTT